MKALHNHKHTSPAIHIRRRCCDVWASRDNLGLENHGEGGAKTKTCTVVLSCFLPPHGWCTFVAPLCAASARSAQVSNWFGNKRIRFKKNVGKGQDEAAMYQAKGVVPGGGAGTQSPTSPTATTPKTESDAGLLPAAAGLQYLECSIPVQKRPF